jgi:tRNA (Thr-GGU) A37 N-methylase
VCVVSVLDEVRLQVENLEALDLTPILDIKPVLKGEGDA